MNKPCINEYMRVTCTVCKTERTISLTTKDVSCQICRRKKEIDKELQEESAARIKELDSKLDKYASVYSDLLQEKIKDAETVKKLEEQLKFEKIRFNLLAETIKGLFA